LAGTNGKFPEKQIYDPNTRTVKNPKECNIIHLMGRVIFEDPKRKISPTGAKDNPSFMATFEKTFLPNINIKDERAIHQVYLSIEGIEIYDCEGSHLIEKMDQQAGVLVLSPKKENGNK
jgi:hypothetical protein